MGAEDANKQLQSLPGEVHSDRPCNREALRVVSSAGYRTSERPGNADVHTSNDGRYIALTNEIWQGAALRVRVPVYQLGGGPPRPLHQQSAYGLGAAVLAATTGADAMQLDSHTAAAAGAPLPHRTVSGVAELQSPRRPSGPRQDDESPGARSETQSMGRKGRATSGGSGRGGKGAGGASAAAGGGAAISASGRTCRGRVKQTGAKRADLLALGTIILRPGWFNGGYIFPAGFRAQTMFRSSVDLDNLTLHTCEILGEAGQYWPAPTFVVTAADRPDYPLLAKSCTGCWKMVLRRINSEIEGRRAAGEDLPPPPKTALPGPEYFGLNQPEICAAIEALDEEHKCSTYWEGKMDREAARSGQGVPTRGGRSSSVSRGVAITAAAAAPRQPRPPSTSTGRDEDEPAHGLDGEEDAEEERYAIHRPFVSTGMHAASGGAASAAAATVTRRAAPPSPLAQHSQTSSDPGSPSAGRLQQTTQHAQPHRFQQQQHHHHHHHPHPHSHHPPSTGPGNPAVEGPAAGRRGLAGDVGDLSPAGMQLTAAQGNKPVLSSYLRDLFLREKQLQQQQEQLGKQLTRGLAPASDHQGLPQLADRATRAAAQRHLLALADAANGTGPEAPFMPAARCGRTLAAKRQRSSLSSGTELELDPWIGPDPGHAPNALAGLRAGAADIACGADAGRQGGRSAAPHCAGLPPRGASATDSAAAAGGVAPLLHRPSSYTFRERAQATGADAMQLDSITSAAAGAPLPHRTVSSVAELQSPRRPSSPRLRSLDRPPPEACLTDTDVPSGMAFREGGPSADERPESSLLAIEWELLLRDERQVQELGQVPLTRELRHVHNLEHLMQQAMCSKERQEAAAAEAAVAAAGLAGDASPSGGAALRRDVAGPDGPSESPPWVGGSLRPLGGAMAEAREPATPPTRQDLLATLESLPQAALAALVAVAAALATLGPRELTALAALRTADPSGPPEAGSAQRERGGTGSIAPLFCHPQLSAASLQLPVAQQQQQYPQGRSGVPPPGAMEAEGPGGSLYDDDYRYGRSGHATGAAAGLMHGS